MTARSASWLLLVAIAAFAPGAWADVPEPELGIEVRARLGFTAPEIEGTAIVRWRSPGAPMRVLRFLLPANRFRRPPAWDSLSRHHLLAGPTFRAGGTDVTAVGEGGRELRPENIDATPLPEGTMIAVDPGREIAAGEVIELTIDFRTRLPNLFDTFGATEGLVVAEGGWYPLPLAPGACERSVCPRPAAAQTRVALRLAQGGALLVNGRLHAGESPIEVVAGPGQAVSFVLSRDPFETVVVPVGGRRITVHTAPSRELRHRVSRGAAALEALLDTLPVVVGHSARRDDLVVVRLPLRWYPSAPAGGMVWLSDRLLEIFPLLRPLHQREVAYAVYLAEEIEKARGREGEGDAGWIAEGLAWRRAQQLYQERLRGGREVRDWIRLFDLFAIVDRFETAPRIPLLRPFFPVLASDDPLRIRLESLFADRPPGRVVMSELEARLRPDPFEELLRRYREGREPLRALLRTEGDLDEFVDRWLAPYPSLDYGLEAVERNPGSAPGVRARLRREVEDGRPQSVEIALEEAEGEERFFVDTDGTVTAIDLRSAAPVEAVTVDPDRRLIETRLDDNRSPAGFHLLLDSADVEVSSTEFGISTLLVGRRRYDYRKDLAAAGFFTNRSYGVNAGFQLHGGAPIDRNLFRHNVFVYYSLRQLDPGFRDERRPERRTRGSLGGFGLRYNYFDAFWFENPSGSRHLRLFLDGFDRDLGGDFDFAQGGVSLAVTYGVRDDTVLAAQVLNGFSAATRGGAIPNQGLFSLGGFRSIRGIGAEEELGESIFIVRAEIRHLLQYRFDLDLEDLLVARRLQLKAFVDAGRVEDREGRLYDPAGYAVGVGAGVNLFYDFFGFFPTSVYLDVATRADRRASAQFLFGVRQPF